MRKYYTSSLSLTTHQRHHSAKKKKNQHHQVDQVKAKGLRLPSPRWATQPNQKERPLKSPAH